MLRRLLDRWRYRPSRAAALAALRSRYRAAAARIRAPQATRLAIRLRQLRETVAAELQGTEACAGCARRCTLGPPPAWEGGLCCSGETSALFTTDELAALRAAGTRLKDLRPPRTLHDGCIFRAEHGCTLAPADRPNLCVRFLCRDLSRELAARGKIRRVVALCDEIERTFAAFVEATRPAKAREGQEAPDRDLPEAGGRAPSRTAAT